MVKAAVILCGSGRFDGSEIQEAVLSLLHLERLGASWRAFAPDAAQWAVCEHFSGTPSSESSRNQLTESARIARGNVAALGEARVEDFDLLVLPGGNGAARNLCDFAERGAAGTLRPELDALIQGFHRARKPIAAICIAPAMVALSIGKSGPRMTLGPATGEAAQAAAKTGAQFVDCSVDQVCVDAQQRIVSTPAYMLGPDLRSVDLGIALCIREAIRLCTE